MSVRTLADIERDIRTAKQGLKALTAERNEALGMTPVECRCGRQYPIKDLEYIQTHYHVPPSGCCGGDYWLEGDGEWDCPTCGHRNRLYDKPDVMKLKALFRSQRDCYCKPSFMALPCDECRKAEQHEN